MIKDKLENSRLYYPISKNTEIGFEWLKSQNFSNLSDGKYYIDGDKIYANVQTYETKENANYEAHREYIDIQYIIKGKEYIGVAPYKTCKTVEEYNSDKDIEFLSCDEEPPYQMLKEGEFLMLYPHDAHKPSIMINEPQTVKKVVVKVHI